MMKTRNFVIKVLRYITIILFLLIIMIVVIKKWHLIQIWIKCLSQLNRVDIQLAKLNVPIFILCKISCYIHNNIKRNYFQVPFVFKLGLQLNVFTKNRHKLMNLNWLNYLNKIYHIILQMKRYFFISLINIVFSTIIIEKYDKSLYVRLIFTRDNVILRLGTFSCWVSTSNPT